jgi:hypothetical protein
VVQDIGHPTLKRRRRESFNHGWTPMNMDGDGWRRVSVPFRTFPWVSVDGEFEDENEDEGEEDGRGYPPGGEKPVNPVRSQCLQGF